MGVPISNVPRRVVLAASGTGPYNFTFEILAATDVAVYRDDTLLTLTTDYTVTINANGTGYVTLTATPTGATQIAIVGNRSIQRTTDFVTGGDFFANTVNNEMDQQTIFAQQNAEGLARALQAPQTDPTSINMTLPRASVRANKTLAFDTNGNPVTGEVIGDNRGNWAAGTAYNKRDIVKDTSNGNIYYANTSHTSSGSQPISTNADSAKWDLIVDNASAGASATAAASSASAAASSQSAASASASASAASAAAAANSYDSFDDRYLGAKTSNPALDNDGNALLTGALYFRTTSPVGMKVYNGTQWTDMIDAGGTITGAINFDAPQQHKTTAIAALDIDCSTGNFFTKTISTNSTFTFSNPPSGRVYGFTLELTTTAGAATWPASVTWPSGTVPALTAGKTHLLMFTTNNAGARWRGAALVDYTT